MTKYYEGGTYLNYYLDGTAGLIGVLFALPFYRWLKMRLSFIIQYYLCWAYTCYALLTKLHLPRLDYLLWFGWKSAPWRFAERSGLRQQILGSRHQFYYQTLELSSFRFRLPNEFQRRFDLPILQENKFNRYVQLHWSTGYRGSSDSIPIGLAYPSYHFAVFQRDWYHFSDIPPIIGISKRISRCIKI